MRRKAPAATSDFRDIACIILAGGKGKRMASQERHKVCFPIAGVPAIVRAIQTYKDAGLRRFLVVVGQMADQVMQTVCAAHPDVAFVYQPEARGTGHAALTAAHVLAAEGWAGGAMVVMGDKVTTPPVVQRLLRQFQQSHADLILTTLPKDDKTTAGRILRRADGTVAAIVELADIKKARVAGTRFHLGEQSVSGDELEAQARSVNASMYVYAFPKLYDALRHLRPDNAQGELYLTDTLQYLVRHGTVGEMLLAEPTDLMAYNTPAELMSIEDVVSRREKRVAPTPVARAPLSERTLKPISTWLRLLEQPDAAVGAALAGCYGPNPPLIDERRRAILPVLAEAARRFGPDRPVLVCRAPGRINLMGRHVDHRGGYVNVMAISREVILVAAPRTDDVVTLHNVDPAYPDREFRLVDLLGTATWDNWMDFLNSETARQVLQLAPGDWCHYARAPLLRLQHQYRTQRLCGLDSVVGGDIPPGAGLSSSSALVVAFAEAAVAINRLDVAMRDFVDLCGEGEWFVGSRGGSADHAAIRTSKVGSVSRIGFFPFRNEGETRFPGDLQTVIAYSGAQAKKSHGARDTFNQRVACYGVAELLLKRRWRAAAGLEHLRDLVPHRLQVEPADVYRALCRLPERPSRKQIFALLPKADHPTLERIFSAHANLGGYDLRGVALFGVAECLRSEQFAGLLQTGDLDGVRQFMQASHDGDRLWRTESDGKPHRFLVRTDDQSLKALAAQNAPMHLQPGRYACSTEAIDTMVDLAVATPGVVGAQLAGAGLGGCMMIVVRAEATDALLARLRQAFYEPRALAFGAYVCRPVAGAGLLEL